ncbi:MAG: hypothetical protein JSW00_04055 [Thermoplasmata archaeon]|nr:MAG: hypothetical protein JSW00_04055 [Thermoplasmata archaeon]
MTEEVQAEVVQESAPAQDSGTESSVGQEHMVPQSKVRQLVGTAKQKGYDQAAEEFRSQQQYAQQAPQYQQAPQAQSQAPSLGGIDQKTLDSYFDQRLNQYQQQQVEQQQQAYFQQEANRILQEMGNKTSEAKSRYEDFDQTLESVGGFQSVPEVWQYANAVENGGDVLYDLAKNPGKVATILQLGSRDPNLAISEIKRLSNSIKQNQTGANQQVAPEPTRQIKSSNVGVGDGPKSIADFKKMYY